MIERGLIADAKTIALLYYAGAKGFWAEVLGADVMRIWLRHETSSRA